MSKHNDQLDEALAKLLKARNRLDVATSPKGRRTVRRRFLRHWRQVRDALDALYPRPVKEPPVPALLPVPPVKQPSQPTVLPFTRSFEIDDARLFNRLAGRVFGKALKNIVCHEGARTDSTFPGDIAYFRPHWSDRRKWTQVVKGLAYINDVPLHRVLDLYRRFFTELVGTGDFVLSTEQAEMLHRRRVDFTRSTETPTHAG